MSYEIIHPGTKEPVSVIFPNPALRGIAVCNDSVAGNGQLTAKLAQPNSASFLGHLMRDITLNGGPTTDDQLFGFGLESPVKAGREVSAEEPEVIELEGSDHLATAANDGIPAGEEITNAMAKDTPVTFKDGKAKAAVAGEYAFYTIFGFPDPKEEPANTRVQLKRVQTFKS